MFKETVDGQTHFVCDQRLKEDGDKAMCCGCYIHEGCTADKPQPTTDEWKEFDNEFIQHNGTKVEPTWKDPVGIVGPVKAWIISHYISRKALVSMIEESGNYPLYETHLTPDQISCFQAGYMACKKDILNSLIKL